MQFVDVIGINYVVSTSWLTVTDAVFFVVDVAVPGRVHELSFSGQQYGSGGSSSCAVLDRGISRQETVQN